MKASTQNKKSHKCLIISGGDYAPPEHSGIIFGSAAAVSDTDSDSGLTDSPASGFDLVIACDKGYKNALQAGIRPDILIGDFDSFGDPQQTASDRSGRESSADPETPCRIPSVDPCVDIIRLPVMKDDTDTMSAVKIALERGLNDITITCAFGGRFDHSMANIQTAAYIVSHGGRAAVLGADTFVYAFSNDSAVIKKKDGYTLSVFSLSDRCEDVSVSGTLYTLNGAVLTNSFPLGVSNSWAEDAAKISVGNGTLMVILSQDN